MKFVADAPGTDETTWAAQPWWPDLPRLALPSRDTRLVILVAHPDDETLAAGGLIAAAHRAGHPLTILIASDGDASHPDSPTVAPVELGRLRRAEATAAVAALAPGVAVDFLGLGDGRLGEHIELMADRVIKALGTDPAWLLTTWSGDGHPDHEACARAGREALAARSDVRHFEFPIWMWHWADPDELGSLIADGRRFDLDASSRAAKDQALSRYVSQTEPLSPHAGDQPVVSAEMQAHFRRSTEFFLDTGPHPAADPDSFEQQYRKAEDPWEFATRFYEQRRRDVILASLPQRRFRRAFEPGSANGDLTVMLAGRADRVVTYEASESAATRARARLTDAAHVSVEVRTIPDQWPEGRFDLIVLSEVGYYCTDLATVADRILESLSDDGTVVLVHYRRPAPDHPLTAETVHATVIARCGLPVTVHHEEADFVLDVLRRDGRSVSQLESPTS